MYTFDEDNIKDQIRKLSPHSRVAIAALCCERSLPNYKRFSLHHNWGKFDVLQNALAKIWTWLEKQNDTDDLIALALQCEEQAPDTNQFESVYVSPALDSAISVSNTLREIVSSKGNYAFEVASLSRDTVDMYIQEIENLYPQDPDLEEKIRMHTLMQAELQMIYADLNYLQTDWSIGELTNRRGCLVSNIGLTL